MTESHLSDREPLWVAEEIETLNPEFRASLRERVLKHVIVLFKLLSWYKTTEKSFGWIFRSVNIWRWSCYFYLGKKKSTEFVVRSRRRSVSRRITLLTNLAILLVNYHREECGNKTDAFLKRVFYQRGVYNTCDHMETLDSRMLELEVISDDISESRSISM